MILAVFQLYTAKKKSTQCSFGGCLCIPYLTSCFAFKNRLFGSYAYEYLSSLSKNLSVKVGL